MRSAGPKGTLKTLWRPYDVDHKSTTVANRGAAKPSTPGQVQQLLDQHRAGVRVRVVAQTFGVCRTTVTEHARRHGLPLRRRSLNNDESRPRQQRCTRAG